MISEKQFAQKYPSFWAENAPWLSGYIASSGTLFVKTHKPIDDEEEKPGHRFINNIIATTHFKNLTENPSITLDESYEESKSVIDSFNLKSRENYLLNDVHRGIIRIQYERLQGKYRNNLIHDPLFPGYGLLSNCRGDLICGTTLVEIKANKVEAGKHPFGLNDFKQLLIYCALNYLSNNIYNIQEIELFNPRSGFYWHCGVEKFVSLISNSTVSYLFSGLGDYLSDLSESIDLATGFDDSVF